MIAFLAAIAFTAVTAMTSVHAARMASADNIPGRAAHMTVAADAGGSCSGKPHPTSPDKAYHCVAACTGMPGCTAAAQDDPAIDHAAIRRALPVETALSGHGPSLDERPPKPRLV